MLYNFFMNVARIGKYLVPPPLRPRLREEYTYFVRNVYDRRVKKNRDSYMKNGTYLDWYAEQCDNDAKNNLSSNNSDAKKVPARLDWMGTGVGQLSMAVELGLKPQHTLLEFGCGFMRAANHFIGYLDDSNYSGNDASAERVAHGGKVTAEILGAEVYRRKNPHLYVNKDNTFDWVTGQTFDFIWSCSVLAHMPEADIATLLANVRKIMNEKSAFIFSYSTAELDKFRRWEHCSPDERKKGIRERAKQRNHMFIVRALQAHQGEDCIEVDTVNWFHTLNFYKKICEPLGLEVSDISHILQKEDCPGYDYAARLARVTLKK